MEPNPESFFAKEYGFKVKITKSESETWSALNNGRLAATKLPPPTHSPCSAGSPTPSFLLPDRLLAWRRHGRRRSWRRLRQPARGQSTRRLSSSTKANSSFVTLAQEAGACRSPCCVTWTRSPHLQRAGPRVLMKIALRRLPEAYEHELGGVAAPNGCVGWTPFTDEVVEKSNGAAKVLVSNRNLLVIADVLAVNGGFARANPDMVRGLRARHPRRQPPLARDQQAANIGIVAKAFGWSESDARDELSRVHLANLPENRAFFSGTIDSAGSFGGIFQSSVLAYGSVIRNPTDASRFADVTALAMRWPRKACSLIRRLRSRRSVSTTPAASLEGDPLLKQGHSLLLRSELGRARQDGASRTRSISIRSSASCRSAPARPCCCGVTSITRA